MCNQKRKKEGTVSSTKANAVSYTSPHPSQPVRVSNAVTKGDSPRPQGPFRQGSVRSLSVAECTPSRDDHSGEVRAPERAARDSDAPVPPCILCQSPLCSGRPANNCEGRDVATWLMCISSSDPPSDSPKQVPLEPPLTPGTQSLKRSKTSLRVTWPQSHLQTQEPSSHHERTPPRSEPLSRSTRG